MAQSINLRQAEYQAVVSELGNFHSSQLASVTDILEEIKQLVTEEDGFTADATSAKIVDVVDCISTDIVKHLEQAFEASEAGTASMMASVMAVDTACNG